MAKNQTAQTETAPAITADMFAAPIVNVPAVKAAAQPKNTRSEAQMALDKITPDVHEAWVRAGKPSAFAKIPTISYPVAPERVTRLKGMIRKAAEFNGDSGTPTRARFGADVVVTPELVKEVDSLTDAHVGLVLVTFGVMDKTARANGSTDGEAETTE